MSTPQARLATLRARRPFIDHVVRMVQHFGEVKGSLQAGAVTYFAFLSFFPILALGFYAVGKISKFYPQAQDDLVGAIRNVFPKLVGEEGIPISSLEAAGSGIAAAGIAGVLYAGLGWITAMRAALVAVFELPSDEQLNFVLGKLRDLAVLAAIGALLIVSVAVTGFVSGFADLLLGWLGLDAELDWLVKALAFALGFVANVVLFFALFRLLGRPHAPNRSLWSGAVLGAIAFEALKRLSFLLLASTQNQPAFQAFGIALILVVWINYFSRVVLYAAAWAHTTPAARAQRDREQLEADRSEMQMKELAHVQLRETPPSESRRVGPRGAFAAGGASMLGLVALLRRRKDAS